MALLVNVHSLILAAAARCVCSGPECVPDPLDGPAPVRAGIDTDNVEPRRPSRECGAPREKNFGCPDELFLFRPIHGQGGARESAGGSVSHFDEYDAIIVEHDEIDLAMAAAKIALDRRQSPVLQVSTGK